MRRFSILLTLLTVTATLIATDGFAQSGNDRIQRRNGTDYGKISSIKALTVTISKRGVESSVAVEEIRGIHFAGEPTQLNSARLATQKGHYKQALEILHKISGKNIQREAIVQEIDFLRIFCTAKLAIGGQGSLEEASTLVSDFLANSRTSYHLTEMVELSGDLSVAKGNYDSARKNYARLTRAPSAYFKTRAAILIGSTFQVEGSHAEAIVEFEKAIQLAGNNAAASSQRAEAILRRAVSHAAMGQVESSTVAINTVVAEANANDEPLLAQAYNALGECYLHADKKKLARNAFLHVDLLFASVHEEHAKALYQLSQLWPTLGHPQRAADARERLKHDYQASPWANR